MRGVFCVGIGLFCVAKFRKMTEPNVAKMLFLYISCPRRRTNIHLNPTLLYHEKIKRQLWDRRFRRNSSLQTAWDSSIARLPVFIFSMRQTIYFFFFWRNCCFFRLPDSLKIRNWPTQIKPTLLCLLCIKEKVVRREYNLGTTKYLVSRMALPKLLSYA